MPNYQLGKIYAINVNGKEYIGSTASKFLSQRRGHHIEAHRNIKSGKSKWTSLLDNEIDTLEDGWKGVNLTLIENHPCKSKKELLTRERFWIEQRKPEMNARMPIVSADEKKARVKAWKQTPEVVQRRQLQEKEKYKIKKDDPEYKAKRKAYAATYRSKHKEAIKEREAKFRDEHREEYNLKRKEAYTNMPTNKKEKLLEGRRQYYASTQIKP